MLGYIYNDFKKHPFYIKINKFYYSKLYLLFIVILMSTAFFLNAEILVYYIFMINVILISLFSFDMLPLVPMLCCGYMTISRDENPLFHPDSLLLTKAFGINLGIIVSVIIIFLVLRLIFELKYKEKVKPPKLIIGIIIFTTTLIIGGLFTQYYTFKNILYGLLLACALFAIYIYLYYTVNWNESRMDYLAHLFTFIGLALVFVSVSLYFYAGFDGKEFLRINLYTGWGLNNNLGGVLVTSIPFTMYLAYKKHNKSFLYSIIACLIMGAIIFSQSRNSMLFGTIFFLIGLVILIITKRGLEKLYHFFVYFAFLLLLIIPFVFYLDEIKNMFYDVFLIGFNNNGRFILYENGIKAFKESPILGTGFYDLKHCPQVYFPADSFMPPRYHNTIIQIMASLGIIGILAFIYHTYEVVRMFVSNINVEKVYIGFAIATILIMSMFDCQLFNFGPSMHYSCLLIFLEMEIGVKKQNLSAM